MDVEEKVEKKPLINIWPETPNKCAFYEFTLRAKHMLDPESLVFKQARV